MMSKSTSKKNLIFFLALLLLFFSIASIGQESESDGAVKETIVEEVIVTGGLEGIQSLSGSATYIGKEDISRFDTTDLNALLAQAPGIYIRQEDGFGLRPNIGIRGTSNDRSSKITIMEDGMLIGPAPYAAPAAYYIPNVNRMSATEVIKGPSAVKHGPHTVGGAINFATRPISQQLSGEVGLSLGEYNYQKYSAFVSDSSDQFGYLIEGLRYSSDGFKKLESGADTGFVRNDFNTKLRYTFDHANGIKQNIVLKLGYADESSDETYLGLTDEDFAIDPNRRYPSSELDHFDSEHQQLHLIHTLTISEEQKWVTKAYYNRFEREWNKFDGLDVTPFKDARDVLNGNESGLDDELALLRGDRDSDLTNIDSDRIDVTNNARKYGSEGIETQYLRNFNFGNFENELTVGVRVHRDYAERDHQQRLYAMISRELVLDENRTGIKKTLNRGEADALAFYAQLDSHLDKWRFNVGFRAEDIESTLSNFLIDEEFTLNQNAFTPGAGVVYQFNDAFGLLFGVYKGFSPVSATTNEDVDPEESVNYEYGLRYYGEQTRAELIGFYSDYSNLLARCRSSEPCFGFDFNGGEAEIQGLEAVLNTNFEVFGTWQLPLAMQYTYTDAIFENEFVSGFSQWGEISVGDRLPYIPRHQANVRIGIENEKLALALMVNYIDEMLEASGDGVPLSGEKTDALTTVNFSARYQLNPSFSFKLVAENVLDEQKIVSRNPFGARPNLPRLVKFGVQYEF